MALTKTIQSNFGLEIPNAYHRVGQIQIVNKTDMTFIVKAFIDDKTNLPIQAESYTCGYVLTGDNALAQAYIHLKTLPEFADAVDC